VADKPKSARKFYAVMAVAMVLGLALNYLGFNTVKLLFWAAAVINGLLAPPLILLVILLTSNHKVMGKRVNPPLPRYLGWATFGIDCGSGRNDHYVLNVSAGECKCRE
jgi:Mn2+/Fe2+ NRAMP family transporter